MADCGIHFERRRCQHVCLPLREVDQPPRHSARIHNDGNVGVGTGTPGSKLDLSGALTVREMVAPGVSAADQGLLYFDATSNKFRVSENGGAFVDLLSAVGANVSLSNLNVFTLYVQ